jgi:hypothetical protein
MVLHNTGVFNEGRGISGLDIQKNVLQTLHTPAIYILGGPRTLRMRTAWTTSTGLRTCRLRWPICRRARRHVQSTERGRGRVGAVSWLDWQLRGDTKSAKRFVGDDCGLCQDAQWSLQRKQFAAARGSR